MSRTYRRKNIKVKRSKFYCNDDLYKSFHRDDSDWGKTWSKYVKEHTNMSERAYIKNSLHKAKYDYYYDIVNYKKYYKRLIWVYD